MLMSITPLEVTSTL